MARHPGPIALQYDDDAYVETLRRPDDVLPEQSAGLMGRQVAGKEFLDAYLTHGTWTELVALVRRRSSAESLRALCRDHPSSRLKQRRLRLIDEHRFHGEFLADLPASPLHIPCPLDSRFAWARQTVGSASFALCGVTHTLCSAPAMRQLCELVTAPFEPFDVLVCTSRAVIATVQALTQHYADYLRDRHGGDPQPRATLAHIPLGVDTERFRPCTAEERAAARTALRIAPDEVAALFVGRLSHHAKAHPFPMFRAISQAAARTGSAVHLLLAGWAPNTAVHDAFIQGAQAFAPGVRVSIVDGNRPEIRTAVWRAADLFTSLSDNIQETFGLVVIEAMASGLPVVASDWDGYRDLVDDGSTGYLVPTLMVQDATHQATSRLLFQEIDYDHFLAECSQTVAIDVAQAADAYARLIADASLRRQMGEAARRAAVARFAWPRIIEQYETIWAEQEHHRQEYQLRSATSKRKAPAPAIYPDLEHPFGAYPTTWLRERDRLIAVDGAEVAVETFLNMPLTNHVEASRVSDPALLRAVLNAASRPRTLSELDWLFTEAGASHQRGRATLAWLLKYGLLVPAPR